jgi:MFS family permease
LLYYFIADKIGNIAANTISGLLLDYFDGWSAPFYFFGVAGVVWFICFVSFIKKTNFQVDNNFQLLNFEFSAIIMLQ